jgi:hypothetical protein
VNLSICYEFTVALHDEFTVTVALHEYMLLIYLYVNSCYKLWLDLEGKSLDSKLSSLSQCDCF